MTKLCPKCGATRELGRQHCDSPHCPWGRCPNPECRVAIDQRDRTVPPMRVAKGE